MFRVFIMQMLGERRLLISFYSKIGAMPIRSASTTFCSLANKKQNRKNSHCLGIPCKYTNKYRFLQMQLYLKSSFTTTFCRLFYHKVTVLSSSIRSNHMFYIHFSSWFTALLDFQLYIMINLVMDYLYLLPSSIFSK